MRSEAINEIAAALAKAQGEIEGATKNAENPHYKNRYADLAAIWDACRAPLSKNGLSVVQTVGQDEDGVEGSGFVLTTTLCHASGQWIESRMHLLLAKQDMQGLGSALSYARRYSIAAIVGVAQEDDDAEGAVNRTREQQHDERTPLPPSSGPTGVAPLAGASQMCCGGNMLVSKFNPNEIWCPKCRKKQARAA